MSDPLDELYAAPLEVFIATRDALAKKLKAAGEKDAAAEVKKAHKPTVAAHALNQLVRTARKEIDELFAAGSALASGKDFKASLERQRAALEAVRAKASGDDAPAIVAAVQGALVDPKLAEAVKAGRFAKLPEVPVGFFGAAPEGAPVVQLPKPPPPPMKVEPLRLVPRPEPAPPPAPAPAPAKPSAPTTDRAAELRDAEKEAETLAAEVEELESELREAKRQAHEAAERVKKLRARQ